MSDKDLICSFCSLSKAQTNLLVAGQDAHICDSCIEQAYGIIVEENKKNESDSVSQDLKIAKAYVLPLGRKDAEKVIKKLREYSFLIRKVLSQKDIMKYIPKILFAKEDSFEYAEKIENLIKQTNK